MIQRKNEYCIMESNIKPSYMIGINNEVEMRSKENKNMNVY